MTLSKKALIYTSNLCPEVFDKELFGLEHQAQQCIQEFFKNNPFIEEMSFKVKSMASPCEETGYPVLVLSHVNIIRINDSFEFCQQMLMENPNIEAAQEPEDLLILCKIVKKQQVAVQLEMNFLKYIRQKYPDNFEGTLSFKRDLHFNTTADKLQDFKILYQVLSSKGAY